MQYASTLPSGTSDADARAAAKTKFIADLKTAGHDVENIGKGILDWMIQTAYTYSASTVAAIQAASGSAANEPHTNS